MSTTGTASTVREQELLESAREGNEDAFRELVEPHRGELHAHCYRMLGSVHDAEDGVQDALLRAWRALPRFEPRHSLRAWLYKIATNVCLDAIARRPKRVLPIDYGPPTDPHQTARDPVVESVWVEPYPDEKLGMEDGYAAPDARYERREGVELAFVAALQHLPARQRAALILREVMGFSAKETAESLDATTASVNSALQRARQAVEERVPEQSQQATLRTLGDKRLRAIVERFMDAMQQGDVNTVVALLAKDATWSMPPLASWYRGEDIPGFLRLGPLSGEWRWKHLFAHANGQPAVGTYEWDDEQQTYLPFALSVLSFEGERIKDITSFINRVVEGTDPEYYARFPDRPLDPDRTLAYFGRLGLPDRLD
jgi:RNA polymerase sigma-70 factor (ECF subfamily)